MKTVYLSTKLKRLMREGDLVVYNFQRAKYNYLDPTLPKEAQYSASIHSTLYDGDMPVGGECVANYLNGKWEYPE